MVTFSIVFLFVFYVPLPHRWSMILVWLARLGLVRADSCTVAALAARRATRTATDSWLAYSSATEPRSRCFEGRRCTNIRPASVSSSNQGLSFHDYRYSRPLHHRATGGPSLSRQAARRPRRRHAQAGLDRSRYHRRADHQERRAADEA